MGTHTILFISICSHMKCLHFSFLVLVSIHAELYDFLPCTQTDTHTACMDARLQWLVDSCTQLAILAAHTRYGVLSIGDKNGMRFWCDIFHTKLQKENRWIARAAKAITKKFIECARDKKRETYVSNCLVGTLCKYMRMCAARIATDLIQFFCVSFRFIFTLHQRHDNFYARLHVNA